MKFWKEFIDGFRDQDNRYHVTIQYFASGVTRHEQYYRICRGADVHEAVNNILSDFPSWTPDTHTFQLSGKGFNVDLIVTELDRS